jgi:hypothetical protein
MTIQRMEHVGIVVDRSLSSRLGRSVVEFSERPPLSWAC